MDLGKNPRAGGHRQAFQVSEFMVHKVKMETKLKRAKSAHEEETVRVRSEARKKTIAEAHGAKMAAEKDEMEVQKIRAETLHNHMI